MSSNFIVAKFGGSSMKDAIAMKRSAKVALDQKANIVLVSATYGTTNQLVELSQIAQTSSWTNCQELISQIKDKHFKISDELNVDEKTKQELEKHLKRLEVLGRGIFLLKECSNRAYDALVSLGELMSSTLYTWAVKSESTNKEIEYFDIREVMKTSDDFKKALPNLEVIKKLANEKLNNSRNNTIYITQGFIGSTEEGVTTTIGRGGSDYSAALIAEAMNADILQIWTDVAGMATTDPRIVKHAKLINEITFSEASELATFGAKILHPTTLAPAQRANVAVFVGSSYEPNEPGTWIKVSTNSNPMIRAMALKTDQSLITLRTPKMLNAHGFLFEIFKIFNDHKISVDAITTSEISVSLTVDQEVIKNQNLIKDLESLANIDIEKNQTLVSLIGNNINHTPGLGEKAFSAIGDINVRMICLGASKHNFCFLVDGENGNEAIKRLHKSFIEV